jgi:hypothetical protein
MITKFLHISLISVNLLFCLVLLFIEHDSFVWVGGALVWLIIFYSLLRYNQTFLLSILILLIISVSALLFLVFFITYLISNIPASVNQTETAIVSVTGMIYMFGNPLLSLIIIVRKNLVNHRSSRVK